MFYFVLFGLIILLLLLLSMIWPPDSPWSPRWRTSKKVARSAFKLAKVNKKDTVFELGSGEATVLLVAAKEFAAKGVGIEIDPLRYLMSRLSIKRNGLDKEVKIVRGNFFYQDLSSATVVFVYLVPKTLEKLKPKFKKELKKGTPIISYKYEMSLALVKKDEENELYLYTI